MEYSKLLSGIEYEGGLPNGGTNLVTQNSQKVTKGCVFVCIEGRTSDGHAYAKNALENGAGLIVSQHRLGLENEITVKDTRAAFALMSMNYFNRPAQKLTLIAVTGTNGKSTVASLISQMLNACGKPCGLIGTIGVEIGGLFVPSKFTTPEAWDLNAIFARMLKAGCTHVVMEASSQALEQGRLYGLNFALGIFTNLSQDHLDYHGSMENYFAAKEKLFSQCGIILINKDDPYGTRLLQSGKYPAAYAFSAKAAAGAQYLASDIDLSVARSTFCFETPNKSGRVSFPMPGAYSVYNALAAGAAVLLLGCEEDAAFAALQKVQSIKGRCEVLHEGDYTVICDFAHTDDALQKLLGALKPFVSGRMLVLFGCPGRRDKAKRSKMAAAVAQYADIVFLSSDNPRDEDENEIISDALPPLKASDVQLYIEPDRQAAVKAAVKELKSGDMLLLCGKGHEDYQAMNGYSLYFSEHALVMQSLAEKSNGVN